MQLFYMVSVEEIKIDSVIYLLRRHRQKLDVDPSSAKLVDVGNIVSDTPTANVTTKLLTSQVSWRSTVAERPNSDDFVDCDDVPPLI